MHGLLEAHEHYIGLTFERTVEEVRDALHRYCESMKTSTTARMQTIAKLLAETRSEGADADTVIAWVQKHTQWTQAPLKPSMVQLLTEAHLAGVERNLYKEVANLVAWLNVDVERDARRVLRLHQSDMSMFLPYDATRLERVTPYHGGIVHNGHFGGGFANFADVAGSVADAG